MAYCVHCGVKLADSEKRCPLCGTVSIDPAEPVKDTPRPYPLRTEDQELHRSRRFFITLAAMLLLMPAALLFIIDLLLGDGITWSAYAVSSLLALFCGVSVPFLVRRHRTYVSLAADFCILSAYLWFVEWFSDTENWFFPIVLPALALATVLLAAIIMLCRRGKLNKLTLPAVIFLAVPIECVAVEELCSLSLYGALTFLWSPFVVAPCAFMALTFLIINGNRALREEVRRRLHF